jgi:hypothetical protein
MESCRTAGICQLNLSGPSEDILKSADTGFSWISTYFSNSKNGLAEASVKELSNLILSHFYWNYQQISFLYIFTLLSKQQSENSGNIRDTARAVSCFFSVPLSMQCGYDREEMEKVKAITVSRLLSQKKEWGRLDNIYDTAYALSALADAGSFQEEICLDLCKSDRPEWQHPGTTALIITALQKQKNLGLFSEEANFMIFKFISDKADWLISVRENEYWKYTATSCLVLNALIFCNRKAEAVKSLSWILASQNENGSWENDLNTTALSLLTL